jgi:hydrogenase maturation protease
MDTVVIGVGNRMRRDDAAGPLVIDRLAVKAMTGVRLVEVTGDAPEIINAWRGVRRAVVVDAVVSGGTPGEVHRVDAHGGVPSNWRSASTHLVGLAEAVELATVLECFPEELVVYGIEAKNVGPGEGLSRPVAKAMDDLVDAVVHEVTHA